MVSELEIYDLAGRLVWRFDISSLQPGVHDILWDGRDLAGRQLPPSVYFARVPIRGGYLSGKLTRLR